MPLKDISASTLGAELIAMFEESVLDVRHLRAGARFTIGESCDASLPFAGLGDTRELVRVGSSGIEVVHADEVKVELLDGDAVRAADAFTWTRELPSEQRVAILPVGARARITIGAMTLLVSGERAPERQELAPQLGWRDHVATVVVGVLALLSVVMLAAIPPEPTSLVLDESLLHQRMARFVISPPLPPAVKQESAHGATAAPAAKPRSAPIVQWHPKPSGNKGNKQSSTRELVADAVNRAGIVSLLGTYAHTGSIFGNGSAIGAQGEAIMGELGNGGPCDQPGACSNAGVVFGKNDGTGDSIKVGKIGNGPGGPGGHGYASHVGPDLHGRPVSAPDPFGGVTRVSPGGLDREVVRRVVRAHMQSYRFCYERELQHQPSLSGRVVPRFTIDATGRVVAASIEQSTLNNHEVDACVLEAVRRMEFPRPTMGTGVTIVSYPFAFTSAGARD